MNPQNKAKIQKQISRAFAVLILIGVIYAGKSLITDLRDAPTSVAGHAPLKTNVQFQAVDGTPTEVNGYSSLTGSIEKVVDGDTLEFLTSTGHHYRLKLLGIDAPELQQSDSGKTSRGYLQKLLGYCSNEVTVIYKDEESYDAYGRLLGKVLCNGKDINLRLVGEGHAWVYSESLSDLMPADREVYLKAEEAARQKKLGLWKEDNPEKPWEWRLKGQAGQSNSKFHELFGWVRKRLGF